jgi:hypothetical protein
VYDGEAVGLEAPVLFDETPMIRASFFSFPPVHAFHPPRQPWKNENREQELKETKEDLNG